MARKIYLTKKRLNTLHIALSIDDVLNETFRRLNEKLREDINKWQKAKHDIVVMQRHKDYDEIMQIIRIDKSTEGTIVFIQGKEK